MRKNSDNENKPASSTVTLTKEQKQRVAFLAAERPKNIKPLVKNKKDKDTDDTLQRSYYGGCSYKR